MQQRSFNLPKGQDTKPHGVPAVIVASYQAANRNIAVLMLRETLAGRA